MTPAEEALALANAWTEPISVTLYLICFCLGLISVAVLK